MARFTVVLDACVLYPAPIRDLLLQLAITGLFKAHWTDDIHNEWISALQNNRPELKQETLERCRALMDAHAEDALVEGHHQYIAQVELPDPNDRHVVAAAIAANADAIVTSNLKDFPEAELDKYRLEAISPDDFIIYQFDLSPMVVVNALKTIRKRLRKPPLSTEEYLASLTSCGLTRTAERLRSYQSLF